MGAKTAVFRYKSREKAAVLASKAAFSERFKEKSKWELQLLQKLR